MIQLMSLLPSSYPGHNILTEDVGELIGEDDCKCGLKGKYFKVHGRLKDAELLKKDAKENKYSVQHAFLLKRYKNVEKKN